MKKIIVRTQRVNGFNVRVGSRAPRKIKDYKERKEHPYKTKVGSVWKDGKYFKTGAYDGKVHGDKKGFVEYDYFKRR